MSSKKRKILRHFANYLIMLATVFTIITIIFAFISEYIYKDMTFLNNLLIVGIASAIASIILFIVLRINNISIVLQVILIYLFLSILVLIVGYILYIYDFLYNSKLFIATSICLVVGLVAIVLISRFKARKTDKSLNVNLKKFKERGR